MSILTIILFFIYSWGFGLSACYFAKESKNVFERNLMRIGIGIGVFILVFTLLNLLRIPLDWKIFLILSLIGPVFSIIRKKKQDKFIFKLTKANLSILIVFAVFFTTLYMYSHGSFSYHYLEDDDPWKHTLGIKYVAYAKDSYDPEGVDLKYIDPYPPGYDGLLGILHQTSSSLYWTMKFFNALFLSLGFVFFYFFAKKFTKDRDIALYATIVLAALPSFFTHFIWAHSLVVMLFFPAMYCLEMISKDKKWMIPAMISVSAILLTQPSEALKLSVMFILYVAIKSIYEKKFLTRHLAALGGGLFLSLSWWGLKITSMISERVTKIAGKAGDVASMQVAEKGSLIDKVMYFIQKYFTPDVGSATRKYSISDFIFAKSAGGINVQVGWGIAASILVVIGIGCIIYIFAKKKNKIMKNQAWIGIALAWFIFTFLGTNSMTFNLPIGLFAFRFWLILAIPAAIISAIAIDATAKYLDRYSIPKILTVIVIIIAVIMTAGVQKYKHNTNPGWHYGIGFTSPDEIQAHTFFATLPDNTKVFHYNNRTDIFTFGFDMYSCSWCPEVIEFRENMFGKDESELYRFLKREGYEYVVIGGISYKYYMREYGKELTIDALQNLTTSMVESSHFNIAYQTQGAIIFKVN